MTETHGSGQWSHRRRGHSATPSVICLGSLKQRMTGLIGLERTSGGLSPTSWSWQGQLWGQTRLCRALFSWALKSSRDRACTTCLWWKSFPSSSAWNISGVHVSSAARITKTSSKRSPHHEKRMKAAVPGSTTITSPGKALLTPGAALGDIGKGPLYCPKLLHAHLGAAGLVHPAGRMMLV